MLNNDELFNEVLIQPAQKGANQLFVVSGYASAAMTFHHFKILEELNYFVKISLIVGMTIQDGLSLSNHT
ncbi:MAG: NgoFVII family restriction endonuclease, partial [Anaerolineaceae bacterium]|nr:NgoFVII family restriction endonuclease [Anaerolineaceae bacterium]